MLRPHKILIVLALFFCLQLQAMTVNRLNGGMTIVYVDFSITGTQIPLELVRSYNSISAVNENNGWLGAFGWGWTSGFETTLTTTPERHVILRDGSSGNTIIFKPEKEDPKVREAFFKKVKAAYFEVKKGRKLTERELSKLQLPTEMAKQLRSDPQYRIDIAGKYNIEGVIPKSELLISSEYGYQTLQFKNGRWIRQRDPYTQVFDNDGRLIRQTDKSGYAFEFKYSPTQKNQIAQITTQDKASMLQFNYRQEKVVEITDNRNRKAKYTFDQKGNLTQSVDSNNQTYKYSYEHKKFPHLLTKIEYVNESNALKTVYRQIGYDDNGLVNYHRDKDGSETNYTYGKMSSNSENNFWTKTVKKSGGKTEEQYDEYLLKTRADGSKYLYRQETKEGKTSKVTVFNPCCGKPLQVTENGETTNYKYYENGLLKEKSGPKEDVRLEYDSKWRKVSKVVQNGVTSFYDYDSRGNLVKARNSRNDNVALTYDRLGRILEMIDREGKKISFKYNDQGKPTVISEKGVGTIKIQYDAEGRVRKTETVAMREGASQGKDQSAEVIRRVMQGFQHLLDIIRPASASFAG